MLAEPTPEEIISALESSGYLMEQEVATKLEALSFHVQTNRAYQDAEENKSREIDVSAIRRFALNEERKLSGFVELIVECKNNTNPFVFIGRPKNEADFSRAPEEIMFPLGSYFRKMTDPKPLLRSVQPFFEFGFDKVHYDHQAATKAVQFCRIDRKGKDWHANHGGLYDAIFYPLAKALIARKNERPKRSANPDSWKYLWIFVPIVVVNGRLLYVDSTKSPPEPAEREWVSFQRELKSEKMKGTFNVTFVQESSLESFVAALEPMLSLAKELIEKDPKRMLSGNLDNAL